ncbi:TetR/AcrR family transcriptional regulator [Frondihabitans australicus]|uniref:TetR family transcriptional regulator n=1 Tax=Frondihabitans australicus TaxID=386892 RepID=A0A495IK24_9MICO|nr:TetR/AcrR family transcriptional regulator [Frondihabitans australicus]RKR76149.1 TetR family transcriptional regulator [Frondihabitans australicus]
MTSQDHAPARVRAPRRDAAENRESLIRAAATLLDRDPGASLDAIAAEAGLSRRAVYGHFATRDDLLRELALHGAARINAAVVSDGAPDEPTDPATRLALVAVRLWNEVDHVRTMALVTVRGPHMLLVGDALAPLRQHVQGIVERGVEAGSFRTDIDPERLSRLVESAAISVLDEATRHGLTTGEGRRLVALSALSMAGFSYGEAAPYLEAALLLDTQKEDLP